MAKLRLSGDTSGWVDLVAPAVAPNTTYTFSAANGIVMTTVGGVMNIAQGGTGQTAITVNGALLIANTVSGGYDVNPITAGHGITVTNDKGSITLSRTFPFMKSVAVMSPAITDNIAMFFTRTAITWTEVVSVVRGSATPNVVFRLTYANTRVAGGTETNITENITCANTTNGVFTTSFTNATVPANNYVLLRFSTVSGTVDEIDVTMIA